VTDSKTDAALLRKTAIRLAWQFAAVAAALIVIAVAGALLLEWLVHRSRPVGPDGPRPDHDDDEVLRTSLLIAGAVAVLIAGLAGFWLARRAVAPLGEALSRQRRFVADAGHELRTPLTVLHTRAQLVLRRMSADDPARPEAEQLLADSRVLGTIVEELLESAQLAAGAAQGEPVDLDQLVRDVVGSMRALADEAGISLSAEIAEPVTVVGTEAALRRALVSLIDNALGHTPSGGAVQISLSRHDDEAAIQVDDDGDGLPPDAASLTERFARGTSQSAGPAGRRFGLGLALVVDVASAHGGRFDLLNREPRGARAVLRLPVAD
jgi:signal transduction histidine kinase